MHHCLHNFWYTVHYSFLASLGKKNSKLDIYEKISTSQLNKHGSSSWAKSLRSNICVGSCVSRNGEARNVDEIDTTCCARYPQEGWHHFGERQRQVCVAKFCKFRMHVLRLASWEGWCPAFSGNPPHMDIAKMLQEKKLARISFTFMHCSQGHGKYQRRCPSNWLHKLDKGAASHAHLFCGCDASPSWLGFPILDI